MAGLSDDEVMAAPAPPQQAPPQPQVTPQQPAEWDLASAPRVAPHAVQGNSLEQTDLGDADYARLQAKLRGEFVPAPKAVPVAKPDQALSIGQQAIANVRAGKPALSEPPRTETASAAKGMSDDEVMAPPPAPKGGSGLGRGLLQGTGYLLGMPADVAHMTDRAYEWAMSKALEKLGVLSPDQAQAIRQPIEGLDDKWGGSSEINKTLLDTAQSLGANTNPPQTGLGRFAESAASFIPSSIAMGPASSAREIGTSALRQGAVPGIVSEGAGEATKGTAAEPYVRAATAIAAGQPLGALSRTPNRILGSVLRDVTPQQFSDAQAILNASRAVGAPLTLAEAIQGVTNSGTRMGDIQRVVEQSPAGASVMRPFFAQRPAQTEAFGRQTLGQISTSPLPVTEVAPRVQEAAMGPAAGAAPDTAAGVEQARTAAVTPFYRAAATDQVPPDRIEAILQQIDRTIAEDHTGILHPQLNQLRSALTRQEATPATASAAAQPRVPVTDIANLDRARKYFRDAIDLPDIAAAAIPKEVGKNVGDLLKQLRAEMTSASQQFAAGKNYYQYLTQTQVAPLQRSATGQIAATGKLGPMEKIEKQLGILFNANPLPGSETQIGKAVRVISATDPEAAKQLVRIHLERTFNEATQANLPGGNQFGGPKFAAVAAGNVQQEKNLEAAIAALPQGNARLGAYRGMMRIFRAMGTRMQPGSMTAYNQELQQELRGATPLTSLAPAVTSPWALAKQAERVYGDWKYGRNTAEIARALTEGNVNDLRRLALAPSGSPRAQAALVALVGSGAPGGDVGGQRSRQAMR